ncbi:hypothetical protein AB8A31_02070 [Tardiphaga sp. 804_B3_N1_9]
MRCRIARIERGRGDVLLEEKVDRINQALGAVSAGVAFRRKSENRVRT